jgi:subtilase family protein
MAIKGKGDEPADGVPEKTYAAKLPNRKYGYFRDDQITFLVTRPEEELARQQLQDFATAINSRLEPLRTGLRGGMSRAVIEKTPEAISFPKFTDGEILRSQGLLASKARAQASNAFSLIKCELKDAPANPAALLDIINTLNNQSSQNSGNAPEPIAGLTVQGASPNWLVSIASQAGGTGGPGGKPFPYYGSRKNAPYHFDIVTKLMNKKIYGDGEGVDVAILDTAPCAQDLVAAYKEWPDHPLIATLLGPNGKLHLYPATYEELLRLTCTSLNDHDYKMTDHGLFIAGIIHSIVPKAEIHLIEVLNQFGVGDFTSFVQGLLKVRTEIFTNDRLGVINCSFMFESPRHDNHCRHMDQTGNPDADFERAVREFSKSDQGTLRMLEFLFDQFFGLGKQAIAAAGNDARTGDPERTPARYPAALRSVKGVGAFPNTLDKLPTGKYRTSVYSNFSESPDKKGVVIRGIDTLGGEEGEGKGILGLYLGEFPGAWRNDSKWAWWAGTSFAAPILTGAVASILSRKANNITRTQDAIKKLYGKGVKIIIDGGAGKQEDALPVTQR